VSTNTERAYAADLRDFAAWCADHGCSTCPAPPAEVASFLRDRAETLAPTTVARRLAAVVAAHRAAGEPSPRDHPEVRRALASIEWRYRARRRPTRPLDAESLARLSLCLPATVTGARDRALMLIGYGAALRRTELVALDVTDVVVTTGGALRIALARGGVVIPPGSRPHLCVVRAWHAWTAAAGIDDGPAFRPIDRHDHVGTTRCPIEPSPSWSDAPRPVPGSTPTPTPAGRCGLGMILSAAAVGASDEVIMHHNRSPQSSTRARVP